MNPLQEIFERYKRGEATIQQVQEAIQSSPELAAYAAKQQELADQGKKTELTSGMLDLLKNLGYTAFSLNQIATAQSQAKNLNPPAVPSVPGLSPELTQQIYQAQRGVDYSPAVSVASQGIEDAYTGALNQARSASGGQAGAYQAMSQLANIERMKAQLGLAPIAQQVYSQNQQNLNSLVGQRVDERQQQYLNQLYGAQLGADLYSDRAQAIGALGSAGTTNLLDSVGRVTDNLKNLSSLYSGFDSGAQEYMNKVRMKNIANTTPQISKNPYYNYTGIYEPNYNAKTRGTQGTV